MRIAYVIGTTIATMKNEKLTGRKLLIVKDADLEGKTRGEAYIAVDSVDAGTGDLVIITEGSSARQTETTLNLPVDAVIVGVIDSLQIGGKDTYRKG